MPRGQLSVTWDMTLERQGLSRQCNENNNPGKAGRQGLWQALLLLWGVICVAARGQERRPYLSASTSSLQNGKLVSAELVWALSIFNSISNYKETQGKWSACTGIHSPGPCSKVLKSTSEHPQARCLVCVGDLGNRAICLATRSLDPPVHKAS